MNRSLSNLRRRLAFTSKAFKRLAQPSSEQPSLALHRRGAMNRFVPSDNYCLDASTLSALDVSVRSGRDRAARTSMKVRLVGRASSKDQHRGFTLLETVLVIAIISLLIAMLLPSLSRLRVSGREIVSQSNARQHASVMSMYAHDNRETWPYLTDPTSTSSVIRYNAGRSAVEIGYFSLGSRWGVALADAYYDGNWASPSQRSPFANRNEGGSFLHYDYPCVFIGRPEYWNPETRKLPPSQLLATRVGDVQFPSHKTLIVDSLTAPGGSVVPDRLRGVRSIASVVDGSAGAWRRDQIEQGIGQ